MTGHSRVRIQIRPGTRARAILAMAQRAGLRGTNLVQALRTGFLSSWVPNDRLRDLLQEEVVERVELELAI